MNSACAAVALSRATAYRRQQPKPLPKQGPRRAQARRIPDAQRMAVLDVPDSNRFIDQLVLDLFSRYPVAWMVAERENSALAKQLFAESISRYDIEPGNLIVHQDRGAPMTAHGFTELLGELGVERSYSRPRVSNDNPFSESLFHTTKYQPDYPGRFADVQHARRWCTDFFQWYSDRHHHTGLALFTPADVYFGRVETIARCREEALAQAYAEYPERFVAGPPRVARPPVRVLINPAEDQPLVTGEELLNAPDCCGASWMMAWRSDSMMATAARP